MKNLVFIIPLVGLLFTNNTLAGETVRVAHQKDYRPYSWIDNREPKGLLIDWWKLWASKTEVELEFIEGSTEECISLVIAGKADVVAGLFLQDGPKNELEYSEYIMRMNTILLLKKRYRPKSVMDIDKSIGVLENELSHQIILDKYPELELKHFDTFESLSTSIINKEVDGFVYEYPKLLGEIRELKAPSGYYKFEVIKEDRIRPAVRAGNSELLQLLITGSARITDSDLGTILEGYDQFEKPIPIEWIILILIVVILFLLLVAIKLYRSQKNRAQLEGTGNINIEKIIEKGENDHIEFKSSFRWDYRQEMPNKALEHVIAKTIAAFLNTNGGMLLIGVDDDGNILGLERDYHTLKKSNRDGFILALTNLINQNLGKNTHRSIDINIVSVNEKDVCIIDTQKSENPVFVEKNNEEEFFMRTAASSQPLGMKEAMDYIQNHWSNNKKG